jgi:hypothetical protein
MLSIELPRPNMTVVQFQFPGHGLAEVLFSYTTPVALRVGRLYFKTNETYSRTTSKHISLWLDGRTANLLTKQQVEEAVESCMAYDAYSVLEFLEGEGFCE